MIFVAETCTIPIVIDLDLHLSDLGPIRPNLSPIRDCYQIWIDFATPSFFLVLYIGITRAIVAEYVRSRNGPTNIVRFEVLEEIIWMRTSLVADSWKASLAPWPHSHWCLPAGINKTIWHFRRFSFQTDLIPLSSLIYFNRTSFHTTLSLSKL